MFKINSYVILLFSHLYHMWCLIKYLIDTLGDSIFNIATCSNFFVSIKKTQHNRVHSLSKENILWFFKCIRIPSYGGLKSYSFCFLHCFSCYLLMSSQTWRWNEGWEALKEEVSGWLLIYQTAWSQAAVESGLPLSSNVRAFNVLK